MTALSSEANTAIKLLKTKFHAALMQICSIFKWILASCLLTGTAAGTCTLEFVIDAGIATGMVCPLGRCNSRGKGPGTGLKKEWTI